MSSPLLVDEGRGLSQLLVVRLPDTTTIEIGKDVFLSHWSLLNLYLFCRGMSGGANS